MLYLKQETARDHSGFDTLTTYGELVRWRLELQLDEDVSLEML